MDTVNFPYRHHSHLPFLRIVDASGAWDRQDLDVDYEQYVTSEESHEALANGTVEFVGGNHITPYATRASGDKWVYLGQTINEWAMSLAVRPDSDIHELRDVAGKRVVRGGMHPNLNAWLILKRGGVTPGEDVEFVGDAASENGGGVDMDLTEKEWEVVKNGEADAAFVWPPYTVKAKEVGLRIVETPPLPQIHFSTVSTTMKYAQEHPDICKRFIQGLSEGIQYYKDHRNEAIAMMVDPDIEGEVVDLEGGYTQEEAEAVYDWLAPRLTSKLYPTLDAIEATYELAVLFRPEAESINPMALWDMHFLRELDDSGNLA